MAAPEQSLAALATRFQHELGQRAAIVGPHGSGKSTLLTQLVPLLGEVRWRQSAAVDRMLWAVSVSAGSRSTDNLSAATSLAGQIVWLTLRRRQRPAVPQILRSRGYWSPGGLLVLDGLEQLRSWEYGAVRLLLAAARMGLLATCHRAYRTLPCLTDTTVSPQTLQSLIAGRLDKSIDVPPELQGQLTDLQWIKRLLAEEQGSAREVFMRLYDVVEDHRNRRPIAHALGN